MSKYILIKGDVSGIQEFIFNVKSDKAAKQLKGRSFFIKLLIEVVMLHLFDKSGIQDSNIDKHKISVSGGNFVIKLPEENENIVAKTQNIFTKALQYTGLNIAIDYVPYEKSYSDTLTNLNAKIREKKLQFFSDDFDYYIPHHKTNYSTHLNWLTLTDTLKNTIISNHKTFEIEKNTNNNLSVNHIVTLPGYTVRFKIDKNPDNIRVFNLEDYLESLFPLHNRNIKQFNDLAKHGSLYRGINKLGILSMDVDGLGNIIECLKDETEHKEFDNKLKEFFNHKLRQIITSDSKFNEKIYTVTAGGDDSFFVGKWNTILDLALTINKAFTSEFKDKKLTISAGFIMVDPKFPVVRFAELAERALKKAKYNYDTKGNICIFDEVVQWNKLNKIQKLRDDFRKVLKGDFTSGKLAKARTVFLPSLEKNVLGIQDFWQLSYYLRDIKANHIIAKINNYLASSVSATNDLEKRNWRLIMPIAARLAEFDKRN